MEESASQFIAKLLALPPRERLEAYREIQDPEIRRQVVDGMPGKAHMEMMGEAAVEGLNRGIRKDLERRKKQKAA
jgi:transposase